jgi:uncharacterized membrane protein YkvA (DUF1232 family)
MSEMSEMSEEKIEIELNPRELRLYDRLRASVVEPRDGLGSGVRDLLLLLPDLTVLLFRLARDSRVPVGSKLVAGFSVVYVLSPIDLMPEILLGPIGLVDDLLVVGAALSQVLSTVHPDIVRQHWSGKGDALKAIERIAEWTNDQVARRIPAFFRGLLGGKTP